MIGKIIGKPKLIGLIGDVNEGKSMVLYFIIEELRKNHKFKLYSYGLRCEIKECSIFYDIEELEQIKNSLIIIDELMSLFDLDNRKQKRQIENTLRLIHHNNNIVILCGVPENFKKFISNKLDMVIFKKVKFGDFINGSRVKRICLNYSGLEKGSSVLNLEVNETLLYNGKTYFKFKIPYLKKYDTKSGKKEIIKKVLKIIKENGFKNGSKKNGKSVLKKMEKG